MSEEKVIAFIRAHIGSVYTLEVLLLLKRDPRRTWRANDLVRELRSSGTAVSEALGRLTQAGLVTRDAAERYTFAPSSPDLDQIAAEIEKAYNATPMSVVKAIVAPPDDKLRVFSDAFRLKE